MTPRDQRLQAKVARRLTHSPRAISVVVLASLVTVACLYGLIEGILELAGTLPLLAAPSQIFAVLSRLPLELGLTWPALLAITILMILGLVALYKALAPGRLDRHRANNDRFTLAIDDAVIAASVSQSLRTGAGLPRGQVLTTISRRALRIEVTPRAGVPLDQDALTQQARDLVEEYQFTPALRVGVQVNRHGRLAT